MFNAEIVYVPFQILLHKKIQNSFLVHGNHLIILVLQAMIICATLVRSFNLLY